MLDSKLRLFAVASVFTAASLITGCGSDALVIGTHIGTGGKQAQGAGGAPVPGTGGAAVGTGGSGVGGSSPLGSNGTACNSPSDCRSGFCASGVCCNTACAGSCNTCAATGAVGTCTPRASGESCGSAPMCDSTASRLITIQVCDGAGVCAPGAVQDCHGFACTNAACGTGCTSDADCASGRLCGAGACVAPPVNLAGNGDVEYGTLDGWLGFAASTVALSDTTAGGSSHGGRYAVRGVARTQGYQGPSYMLPTGVGKYNISVWGMQREVSALTGLAEVGLTCATTSQYLTVQSSGFGINLTPNNWAQFSGTVDTASLSPDCNPTASPPGLVRSAQLFLNQTVGTTYPDLYLDDLVVQATDGHNLVGNPNFEAGLFDGWTATAGTIGVSATMSHGGTHSLSVTGRTATESGPTYALPTGTARYKIALQAMHTGTSSHGLALWAAYECGGGLQLTAALRIANVPAVAASTWTPLSATVTLPEPDAPADCHMKLATVSVSQEETATCISSGGSVECPDLYIDDVSITLAP